jgi:hypothetical protein
MVSPSANIVDSPVLARSRNCPTVAVLESTRSHGPMRPSLRAPQRVIVFHGILNVAKISLNVIKTRKSGLSWRNVAEETDVNKNIARRVWNRKEPYLQETRPDV